MKPYYEYNGLSPLIKILKNKSLMMILPLVRSRSFDSENKTKIYKIMVEFIAKI